MDARTCSVSEAAAALGIGRRTSYRLIADGYLPAVRIGRKRLRVPLDALEDMLKTPARHIATIAADKGEGHATE